MEKEFVLYNEALALKELGFDEPCFGFWNENKEFTSIEFDVYSGGNLFDLIKNHNNDADTNAPTFSQAFRWLYQKLEVEKGIMPLDTESQLLVLKELIEIVKEQK